MLKLLLDEPISAAVARGLRRRSREIDVCALAAWDGGSFLGKDDSALLREAAAQRLTLVTYDRRTIPPVLKAWAEEGRIHGGVIFVDEKTVSPADIGGLVWALARLASDAGSWDWKNRVVYLRR
jgi:hypothetical protein